MRQFIKLYLSIISLAIVTFAKAQDKYYPIEIETNVGISVPTTNSLSFYENPEKLSASLHLAYYKTLKYGYISGLNYAKLGHYDEISLPLYITYRSKPFHSSFSPYQSALSNAINYLVPKQVQFYGGIRNGYIFGVDRKNIKLNRHFVSSLDIGLKGGYMVGAFRAFISMGFDFLVSNNYSFRQRNGYTSPNLFFNLKTGLSWSY